MAERGRSIDWIGWAREGFNQLREAASNAIARNNLRGYVRELRQIPASDREKKRELAAFFQTDYGRRFSVDERRDAYDSLLGSSRNNRQRG